MFNFNLITLAALINFILIISLWSPLCGQYEAEFPNQDYTSYHSRVIIAEKLIAQERFAEGLRMYDSLFDTYDFIFVREYKIATQLALKLGNPEKARHYLREGILSGWKMKSIRKNNFLQPLRKGEGWTSIKKDYPRLRMSYEAQFDPNLRNRVRNMYSRDQKKAMGAIFKFSSQAQDKYSEKKFAPHSELQMAELTEIMDLYGYPGERLVGNDYWMSTILGHHNSISRAYVERDTIYPALKERLSNAFKKGQISPYEMALIHEWSLKVKSGWSESEGYGILDSPGIQTLPRFNELRQQVFLRPIELRNRLVELQQKTGMDFYLPGDGWIKGKIEIKE